MANGVVNLIIKSAADSSGISSAIDHSRRLSESFEKTGGVVKKFGTVVALVGNGVGSVIKHIFKGGVWGVANRIIGFVIDLWQKHKDAVEAAAEAEKKAFDDRLKAVKEYSDVVEKGYQSAISAIDRNIKKINDEIDATKELQKAELELERERLRAKGDAAGVAGVDMKMKQVDAEAEAEKMMRGIEAAEKRLSQATYSKSLAEKAVSRARSTVDEVAGTINSRLKEVMDNARANARGKAHAGMGASVYWEAATDEDRARAAEMAAYDWENSDEAKELFRRRDEAKKALVDAQGKFRQANSRVDSAKSGLDNINKRADAMVLRDDAQLLKDENDAADARKSAEAEAAAKREAEIKKEHETRMKQIEAETAARLAAERKVQAEAASRFEREFALLQDPERMNAAFDAAEKRQADLERMRKDVSRKNIGYMVDEAARYMRAGDEAGLEDRFRSWRALGGIRKGDRETEQLIRTAAAYETKSTAEDMLSKIEGNTANLAEKMDQLISMKGGD